jgi:transposase
LPDEAPRHERACCQRRAIENQAPHGTTPRRKPLITPGETHDAKVAVDLTESVPQRPLVRLGDKGYDTDDVRYADWSRGTLAMIPTKSNRKVRFSVDHTLYSMRHYTMRNYSMRNRIERSFNKIKNARRMATRYDTLAATFLGSVEIVSIRYWIRFFNET